MNRFTLRTTLSPYTTLFRSKPNPPSKVSHLLTRSTALRCEAVLRDPNSTRLNSRHVPHWYVTFYLDQRLYVAKQCFAVHVLPRPPTLYSFTGSTPAN